MELTGKEKKNDTNFQSVGGLNSSYVGDVFLFCLFFIWIGNEPITAPGEFQDSGWVASLSKKLSLAFVLATDSKKKKKIPEDGDKDPLKQTYMSTLH